MTQQHPSSDHHRLRLKLPSGAEFEAEGSPEFVSTERQKFLSTAAGPSTSHPAAPQRAPDLRPGATAKPIEPDWNELIEAQGQNVCLRAKLKGGGNAKEACLLLLAASQRVLRQPKPTAAQIARWMRSSGYPIQRVDRTIQEAVESGEILASGSRRGRRYGLSSPGLAKAFNIAFQFGATAQAPRRPDPSRQIELSLE